jgi:hypothetical protein
MVDIVSTISPSSTPVVPDFTSLQAWEDSIPADLVAADERHIGHCLDQGAFSSGSQILAIGGQTTDATRNIILTAAAGASFSDKAAVRTTALAYNSAGGVSITAAASYLNSINILTDFTVLRGLQLRNTSGGGSEAIVRFTSGADSGLIDRCIMSGPRRMVFADALNCMIKNTLFQLTGGGGTGLFATQSASFLGNTVIGSGGGVGVHSEFGTVTISNTAMFNMGIYTEIGTSGGFAGSHNATDNATFPGSNNQTSLVFADQFNNVATDYRAAGGGDLQAGTPDATNLPVDISIFTRDGTTPWIGAWENGAGDVTPPGYDTVPAVDNVNELLITVDATATDVGSANVNHYAVLVANDAAAPSPAQVVAGQNSTGAAALDADSSLAVANGVEAQLVLTGINTVTPYDVYYVIGDATGNLSAVTKLDATTGAASRTAVAAEASDVPGGVIAFTLTGFSGPPTGATINGVAATIENALVGSVDVVLPGLSAFANGQPHAATRWLTNLNVIITEAGGSGNDSIQIDPTDTDGPDNWFGVAAAPAVDTIFPAGLVAGDDYFIERVSGTINDIASNGSPSFGTSSGSFTRRFFDVNVASWSAIETAVTWGNLAPVIVGPATPESDEGDIAVDGGTYSITNRDGELPTLTGPDAEFFTLILQTGDIFALSFIDAPAYGSPLDANADNVYEITINIDDTINSPVTFDVDVSVRSTDETPQIVGNAAPTVEEGNTAVGVYGVAFRNGQLPTLSGPDASAFSITLQSGDNFNLAFLIAPVLSPPGDVGGDNIYNVTINIDDGINDPVSLPVAITLVEEGAGADLIPPVISLIGSSQIFVDQDDAYVDPGATATDNVDGNLTSSIVTVNPVNTALPGAYLITYNVSDAAGNAANQVTRQVLVIATQGQASSNVGERKTGRFEYINGKYVRVA